MVELVDTTNLSFVGFSLEGSSPSLDTETKLLLLWQVADSLRGALLLVFMVELLRRAVKIRVDFVSEAQALKKMRADFFYEGACL